MDILFSERQLKQAKTKLAIKWLCGSLITAITIFIAINSMTTQVPRDELDIATVNRGQLQTGIAASGTLLPQFEQNISSQLDAKITKVLVAAGETVIAGQPLIHLDTSKIQLTLEQADESIALKNNQIDMSKQQLKQTISDINGQLALLKIDLESRQTKYQRIAQLVEFGISSKHELKEAELNTRRTTVEISQLEQKITNLQQQTHTQVTGLLLEKSILEKTRGQTQSLLESAIITAPNDGLVVWLNNAEGSVVQNGETVIKIADTRSYKLNVSISDFYANQIYQGMTANFDYDNVTFHGRVNTVIAANATGALQVTVELDKDTSKQHMALLRQRLRVDVNLISNTINDTLIVDKGPFISGPGVKHVFVIDQDIARKVQVVVGSGNRNAYQVKSGLKANDQIIISDVSQYAHLNQFEIKG